MKRLLLLLALPVCVFAQNNISGQAVVLYQSNPSGLSCVSTAALILYSSQIYSCQTGAYALYTTSGGSGTVTSVGGLSPLFGVTNPTTAAVFSLSNAAAATFFGNGTASPAAPGFTALSTLADGSTITFSGGQFHSTASGSGTVTSVGLTLPAMFSVTGSPVTTSGAIAATLASQTANTFFAAPNGSPGAPVFRTLVAADVPTLNQDTTGSAAKIGGNSVPANAVGYMHNDGTGILTWGTTPGGSTISLFDSTGTLISSAVSGIQLGQTGDPVGLAYANTGVGTYRIDVQADPSALTSSNVSSVFGKTFTAGNGTGTGNVFQSPAVSGTLPFFCTAGTGGVVANTVVITVNDGTTLASGSNNCVVQQATTASTEGLGVVLDTASAGASVRVAFYGYAQVFVSNATTYLDKLLVSSATAGYAMDSGQTSRSAIAPTVNVIGTAQQTCSATALCWVRLESPGTRGANVQAAINVIPQAITYYVCPAALSNCAYNGDGGQAATPSDSNDGTTKALPFATIAKAVSVISGATVLLPVTIQLADTSTSCYTDRELILNQSTVGRNPYQMFEVGWAAVGGPYAYTDTYPQSYIEFKGNITTPANVSWTGATVACGGTTSGARVAIRGTGNSLVVHGINFKYFDALNPDNAAISVTDHGTLYVDHITVTGSGGSGSYLSLVAYESQAFYGPALNGTEFGISTCDLNSLCTTRTPAGWLTASITNNTFAKSIWLANEHGHVTIWGPTTQSYAGSAAYIVYAALAGSIVDTAEASTPGASAITLNAANATFLSANQFSEVYNSCGSTSNTCTLTSFKQHSAATVGGVIFDFVNTQGSSADTIASGGEVIYTPFGTMTGTQTGPARYIVGSASPTFKAASNANEYWADSGNSGEPRIEINNSTDQYVNHSAAALTNGGIVCGSGLGGTKSCTTLNTATACASSASPAVCAAAPSGLVTVAAAATTVVVNTTAVTATSQIHLTFDSSLGTALSVTCNTTAVLPTVSARTAGTSFTLSVGAAPTTNPACFSYTIVN